MGELSMHPEYDELFNRVNNLNQEIADLMEERDMLRFHECKNLETEYMVKIGVFEYKIYEIQCSILRIRRKIELIRAKLNREETVYMPLIEAQLDEEYAEYQKKLEERMKILNRALEREDNPTLSEENAAELKKLYRNAIKKLHPDLNPDATDNERNLFLSAVAAYENGDLETMRAISVLIDEAVPTDQIPTDGLERLREKAEQLELIKFKILEQIEQIKTSFPYSKKEFLESSKRVSDKQKELNDILEKFKDSYRQYNEILENILKGET